MESGHADLWSRRQNYSMDRERNPIVKNEGGGGDKMENLRAYWKRKEWMKLDGKTDIK
jgi:hypothetical protein